MFIHREQALPEKIGERSRYLKGYFTQVLKMASDFAELAGQKKRKKGKEDAKVKHRFLCRHERTGVP